MLRNYLAAALRNLARNRLYAGLNIIGLGVGFAAAILIALYVKHELTFERFLAGYEGIYRLSAGIKGAVASASDDARGPIADDLKLAFPQIRAITELRNTWGRVSLRHGDVEATDTGFYWADPRVFEVLPFPVVAGDLRTALQRPDGLVLTRRMARKYFGTDLPMGQTIQVDGQYTMRVMAVLEDLPSNTHLDTEIFASALALPPLKPGFVYRCFVYMRLASAEDAQRVRAGLPDFLDHQTIPLSAGKVSNSRALALVPIADIHLRPPGRFAMKPAGDPRLLGALSLVGLLILLTAAINYINLMTARASRRAVEVGVRKAAGGSRVDLAVQFIGESVIYSFISVLLAIMLVELLLPQLNGFLDRNIVFNYWSAPVIAALSGLALLVGILAGIYPALVLSAFRPAAVLKGDGMHAPGTGRLRQLFVLLQFTILIGLILTTGVIQQQAAFGLRQGLRFDHDQLLSILVPSGSCERSPFANGVRALSGVRGSACSTEFLTNFGTQQYRTNDGREISLQNVDIGPGLFELLRLKPVAGRFFAPDREVDVIPWERDLAKTYHTVINETAARQLGYSTAAAAIGQVFTSVSDVHAGTRREIIGVVPDFARDSVRVAIDPVLFDNSGSANTLNLKLRGSDVPQTLQAIDRLWKQAALLPTPISRRFYDQYVEDLYRDLERQATMFSVFAALALLLAAMGLFGLAAFTVERRTREIGVRKALGAYTSDVARLLLWQFAKPVLAANLIAWPLAAWLMSRWLQGFAYHIDLPLWLFPAAAAAALAIALLTVSGHSVRVARAAAVKALRYE